MEQEGTQKAMREDAASGRVGRRGGLLQAIVLMEERMSPIPKVETLQKIFMTSVYYVILLRYR